MAGYGNALLMAWLWLLLGCAPAPAVAEGGTGPPASGPGEATYLIDGLAIALSDGLAVLEPIDGAATRALVKVFGTPVWGDLDHSGGPDAALLLVVDRGGSGSFYYLAVAYNRGGVFVGSEAIFLGDRISPQRLSIRNGLIMVDYAERLPQEAMTVPPSHRMTKYLLAKKTGLEAIPLAQGEGLFADEGPLTLGVRDGRLAASTLTYPASFMLVAAMNPCHCGFAGDNLRECCCTPPMLQRYRSRLSGPLLDRIDLHIEVPRVAHKDLADPQDAEPSEAIRARVEAARALQRQRAAPAP